MKTLILFSTVLATAAQGQTVAQFALQFRESELLRLNPPPALSPPGSDPSYRRSLFGSLFTSPAPWHTNITSTEFWVGERPTRGDPGNCSSAWIHDWRGQYGGVDSPADRRGFLPAAFVPRQNPFYVALPYNDVDGKHTKPEARSVIPWFRDVYVRDGQSVCHGHWVAIRKDTRIAYATWSDVGPFRTDCYNYVFGSAPPAWNKNNSAGIDLSPAVIAYLNLRSVDVVEWRFVRGREVPPGPWSMIRDARDDSIIARNN